MLKNYIKIAWRNLMRNKGFSFLNIAGLAVGMASAMLILLWIHSEMNFDRFYSKSDRIYTLNNRDKFNGELWAWNTTPKVLAPTMAQELPDIEQFTRYNESTFLFTVGDTRLNESGAFVDSAFFKIFNFQFAQGDPNTALDKINNIVITQDFAKKMFGKEAALGKTIKVDSTDYFTVTGVLNTLPDNSRFRFDYVMPWSYMKKIKWDDQNWGNNSTKSYVLLKTGVSQASFDAKIKNFTINHTKGTNDPSTSVVFTQLLSDRWLYSKSENGQYVGGRIEMVKLFAIIAALILLIACINFMNLSTARSEKRAKEVGIRKVVGAQKSLLIGQFIGESVLLAFIAFALALVIVFIALPAYNELVDKKLFVDYSNTWFWLFAFAFIVFTGVLAGSYPAFFLSSFKPSKVLKGTFKASHALVTPRKVLVVLQFTFAIALIICTLIVHQQIIHAQSRDAGYDRDKLVYTFLQGDVEKHYSLIRNELVSSGAATAVTKSMSPITQRWSDSWGWKWDGSTETDDKTDFIMMAADADFVKTIGVKLKEGRDIDVYKYASDSTAIMLNEAAVKIMRLKNPVGSIVRGQGQSWHVVGVMKDFIYESPYENVSQLIVMGPNSWFNVIHFKLNPVNTIEKNLKLAETVFKKYNPQYPTSFNFADESYAQKFDEEKRIGTLAALFAGLTIFISCLGLFGLATYMAENRIKEIGVRKVLGASVAGITQLLSIDFLKLVLISFLIASPIAWWAMREWLSSYPYKISIQWWVFAITGITALSIAFLTVSYQAIRAAIANPVKSLRSE
ncbi:MAG TPA: ABC transporter permease [Phnomibacter sp.]|nr:ABC transporter permease [Phnomibacter sp.]